MGPNRQNWTFPYTAGFLVEHLREVEKGLAAEIDEKLDDEALFERDLAAFRDTMRIAGVLGWDRMQLPDEKEKYRGTRAREYYVRLAKKLREIVRYRTALERDLARDPHRLFKLTFDDLEFLGL